MRIRDLPWSLFPTARRAFTVELIRAVVGKPGAWPGDLAFAAQQILKLCERIERGMPLDVHTQSMAADVNEAVWDYQSGSGPIAEIQEHAEPLARVTYVLNGLIVPQRDGLGAELLIDLDALSEFDPCRDLRVARWWVKLSAPDVPSWTERHAAAVAAVLAGESALAGELLSDPGPDHVR
jgi:hypothetical protein